MQEEYGKAFSAAATELYVEEYSYNERGKKDLYEIVNLCIEHDRSLQLPSAEAVLSSYPLV